MADDFGFAAGRMIQENHRIDFYTYFSLSVFCLLKTSFHVVFCATESATILLSLFVIDSELGCCTISFFIRIRKRKRKICTRQRIRTTSYTLHSIHVRFRFFAPLVRRRISRHLQIRMRTKLFVSMSNGLIECEDINCQ